MTKNTGIEKRIKAFLSVFLSVFLLVFMSVPEVVQAKESYIGKSVTTVKITDIETGETTEYQMDDSSSKIQKDSSGKERITTTFDIGGNSAIMPYTDSSTVDTFSGWRGTVRITYTIDSTTACLEEAFGRWEHVSGSTSRGSSSFTYGQDLGTNSNSGYRDMTNLNGVQIQTGFKPGKYGYGFNHKVGANMSAVIGGKRVDIICNVNL